MEFTDKFARLLGITPYVRQNAAESLFFATENNPMVYWLQLIIAAGIAHLGLVLDSTAVVIGAMLVSPLMTPIIQVGMAFAIGNLYFAIKSLFQIFLSLAMVVLFSASMTRLLPFQEITREISARTQPTAIDLIVAMFCGLAAAFVVSKSSRDTITAAAGTAIAIALVPPLCVIGFGLGISSAEIFWGATLLFTANLAAIILISDLFFLVTGFTGVDHRLLEDKVLDEADKGSPLYRLSKKVRMPQNVSRWRVFRLALPVLFVALLTFPLSRALTRVVWEVNVSKGLRTIMQDFEKENRVFSKQQLVSHGFVALRVTLVGTPGQEEEITRKLTQQVRAVSGIEPSVNVEILPSTEFMNQSLQQTTDRVSNELEQVRLKAMAPPITPEEAVKKADPGLLMAQLVNVLNEPISFLSSSDKSGEWLDWSVTVEPKGKARVHVRRISDQPISEDALSLMAAHLKKETGIDFTLETQRFPRTVFQTEKPALTTAQQKEMLAELDRLIDLGQVSVEMVLCSPEKAKTSYQKATWKKFNENLQHVIEEKFPAERTRTLNDEKSWKVQFVVTRPKPKAPPEPPKPTPAPETKAEEKPKPREEIKAQAQPDTKSESVPG